MSSVRKIRCRLLSCRNATTSTPSALSTCVTVTSARSRSPVPSASTSAAPARSNQAVTAATASASGATSARSSERERYEPYSALVGSDTATSVPLSAAAVSGGSASAAVSVKASSPRAGSRTSRTHPALAATDTPPRDVKGAGRPPSDGSVSVASATTHAVASGANMRVRR